MYLLETENPKKHISFGTTTNRPTFPNEIAHDRFGNEMTTIKGVKDVGPGQYENHSATTFTNFTKKISLKGYMLGARTAERSFSPFLTSAPPPTTYQNSVSQPKTSKTSFKPFDAGAHRFNDFPKEILPGPGTYEADVERNRKVQMLHSFGGTTHMIPIVETICISDRTIKCENCSEVPQGDFHVFKRCTLCNKCFDYNWKWQEKYSRAFLSSFKKVRDCKAIHEHNGTNAAIQKMSDKDIKNLKRKEAYLSLYWP